MKIIHLDAEVRKGNTVMIEQWKGSKPDSAHFISYWDKKVHADQETIAIWRVKYKKQKHEN